MKSKDALAKAEEAARVVGGIKRTPTGDIDYKEDFFGKPAFLTVSGQLQVRKNAAAAPKSTVGLLLLSLNVYRHELFTSSCFCAALTQQSCFMHGL